MSIELKEELTNSDIQSILRMSKQLSYMSNYFRTYHLVIVDQLDNDEEAESEQEVLHDHELNIMKLINCIGKLVGEPSRKKDDSDNNHIAIPQSSA